MADSRIPKYRRHPNGQAFVQHKSIPSKDHRMYLGQYGSERSWQRYNRFVERLLAAEPTLQPEARREFSVNELVNSYLEFAEHYYSEDGKPTKEFRCMIDALKPVILSSSGPGESLAKELGGVGVTGSNQNPEDLKRLVDTAADSFGGIDAVVNSAGHGPKGQILEITDDDWHLAMDVYLLNVIRVTRLVTPILQSRGGGSIVNISTFAAFDPDLWLASAWWLAV